MRGRVARRLVAWFAPADLRERFLNDLDEAYAQDVDDQDVNRRGRWLLRETAWAIVAFSKLRMQRRFGGPPAVSPRPIMTTRDELARHLRQAGRHLRATPAFAAVATITLALGIGANSAMFSVIRAVILQPLPYHDPDRLVMVWNDLNRQGTTWLSLQEVNSYQRDAKTLEQLAGYDMAGLSFTDGAEPERVRAGLVTTNMFDTLGVRPLLGRTFVPNDGRPGSTPTIILSYGLWQRLFGGADDIVGRPIHVDDVARQVVGVMPPSFRLPLDYRARLPTEAWVPLVIDPANLGPWGDRSYFGVGRLRPAVAPSTATAEFAAISESWIRAGFVRKQRDSTLARAAMPLPELITGDMRAPLLILGGAVGLVLLIACANVVHLMLARADVRRREVAIRVALGASRAQIVAELLTESVILTGAGTAVGLLLAAASLQLVNTVGASQLPHVGTVRIDRSVLLFTLIVSSCTALIIGLAPAFRAVRDDVVGPLRDAGRGSTTSRFRLTARRALVVGQLAGSVVLVIGAGLLARSLAALHHLDLGFDPAGVLTAQIRLPDATYSKPEEVVRFYQRLEDRVTALPDVTAAGAVRIVPLTQQVGDWSIIIEDRPARPEENPNGDFQWVTPGYFTVMGLTVLHGRALTAADRAGQLLVVVINETMAKRYWPSGDALGKRFRMGDRLPWMTIVGIVRTTRHGAITESPRAEMYIPHAQLADSVGFADPAMALLVKTPRDPLGLVGPVRQVVRDLDPRVPVSDVRSMQEITTTALARPRFATWLLGVFAGLALTLATIGVYGTMSLLVTERTTDMGIRLALGASRRSVLLMVLRQALFVALVGTSVGLAMALPLARLLATLVFGVTTSDPVTFVSAPLALVLVAVATCLLPAMRAARLDPVDTLRQA